MYEKFKKTLKHYDKFLIMKEELDGTKVIYRQSPFFKIKYKVLAIENKFIGSGSWIIKKLNSMDNQRYNIVNDILRSNDKLSRRDRDTRKMSEDVASLMLEEYI